MKARYRTYALGFAVLLASAPLFGCGGGGLPSEARERLEAADSKGRSAAEAVAAGRKSYQEYLKIVAKEQDVTDQDVAKAKALLESAKKSEEKAMGDLRSEEDDLLAIRDMEVSEEFKTYIDMKVKALKAQQELLDLDIQAMVYRVQSIVELESGAQPERIIELQKKAVELEKQSRAMAARARALGQDAEDFFEEKGLGDQV